MEKPGLEAGFLRVFRMFIVTQIAFWVVIGPIVIVVEMAGGSGLALGEVPAMTLVERLALPNVAPLISLELVLLALLLLPQVPRRLGRWFLPVTLSFGLIPLLVGYYWWPSSNPLQTPFIIFFFVMLVLIAWQYSFRHILVYVVGLTLYQVWFKEPISELPRSVDVGWSILQGAMMLLVGYVIVQLVATQRDQRKALADAYRQQAAANVRLQRYAAAVEELSISRERNRLARELHDTLAHSLSALTVQLEAVRSLWPVDLQAARRQLDRADETARRGLTEARRSLQDLRASPLQDLGLVLALEELARTAAERAGAELVLRLPEALAAGVSPTVEQGVYRIAQEALENVARHAEAGIITLRLREGHEALTLDIEDDGRGLEGEATPASAAGGEARMGLRGMRERANVIGGRLQVESGVGQGTRVSLTVPI
jgi:signal transduction histidine kinase